MLYAIACTGNAVECYLSVCSM